MFPCVWRADDTLTHTYLYSHLFTTGTKSELFKEDVQIAGRLWRVCNGRSVIATLVVVVVVHSRMYRLLIIENMLQDKTLDEEGIPEEEEEAVVEEHGEEEEEHEDEFYASYMGGSYRSLELPEPTFDKVHDILNLVSMNNMMMRSRISNTLSKRPVCPVLAYITHTHI